MDTDANSCRTRCSVYERYPKVAVPGSPERIGTVRALKHYDDAVACGEIHALARRQTGQFHTYV